MTWVLYIFGSGQAFFWGVGLLCTGIALRLLPGRSARLAGTLAGVVGPVLIALSATPLPYGLYAAWAVALFLWLVGENRRSERWITSRPAARIAVLAFTAVALALEAPHHRIPRVAAQGVRDLYVIGDSVAAGMADRETGTWPRLLAKSGGVDVHDLSRMGATVRTALRQADQIPPGKAIVLLEIGGNDLLGTTTAGQFEHDLDQLLQRLADTGHTLVMFELPLPPLANEYGRVQRELAARYGVLLIPKRVFMAVLTEEGATLDSIHLSRLGHRRMAEAVRRVLGIQPP